ncbi:MinD/ParA family protein [Bacillus songklensis]|uniref:MinD/ParA family protein n=1 Tax=Bacillus songklensis TaxID=1069116 RepID=A0ABV8B096_9BACI
MKDQAESLRMQLQHLQQQRDAKAIAVLSGKGGVGKSNFSLNFSLRLSKKGYGVLLCDMDIGMGNIDILMGLSTSHTLVDMFEKQLPIHKVIQKGPGDLSYIAGGTGIASIFELSSERVERLITEFSTILQSYDYVIFDMGAGMSEGMVQFLKAVNEIVIITTPEPTSITDAYAAIKFLSMNDISVKHSLVINKADSYQEGISVYERLNSVIKRFLHKESHLLGVIPDDKSVGRAVVRQVPFILFDPKSAASKAIGDVTSRYLLNTSVKLPETKPLSFIERLRKHFLER